MTKLWLVLLFVTRLSSAEIGGPKDVVQRFCELDMSGARLHSVISDPIWQITSDEGEPPADPIVIVKGFRVDTVSESKQGVWVKVQYQVVGYIGPGMDLKSGGSHYSVGKFLLKEDTGWKISLVDLHVSPHVSVESYIHHLDDLLSLYKDSDESAANQGRRRAYEKLRRRLVESEKRATGN